MEDEEKVEVKDGENCLRKRYKIDQEGKNNSRKKYKEDENEKENGGLKSGKRGIYFTYSKNSNNN